MSSAEITITAESANQPDVVALITALDDLQRDLYPAESNHFVDIDSLTSDKTIFLVARKEDVAIGCGAVLLQDGFGEIKRMMVTSEARGHGLGARIVRALEAATIARNYTVMRLETGIYQPAAIRLYEKTGYVKRGPFADYQADPLSVFMEKKLKPSTP